MSTYAANLTDEQIMGIVEHHIARRNLKLAEQLLDALKARRVVPPKRVKRPRKRDNRTGELL